MPDYRVNLDVFAGPMDLLLYLVRKEEVDIYDISIAKITDQYIRHIEILKSFDIDLAGDFLVMAATLMHVKSAMLLPKDDLEQIDTEDLADPRAELIRQLLEYKKFKDASNLLADAADQQKLRFVRPPTIVDRLKPDAEPELDLELVSIWDLLEAFDSIMKATGTYADISLIKDDTPIDLYQIEILNHLQTQGPMTFQRLFQGKPNRAVMVGLFLALLELIRERLIWVEQKTASSEIYLKSLTDEPAAQAVQKAIIATEQEQAEQTAQTPPIAITELPPKAEPAYSAEPEEHAQPIPIKELLPQEKSSVTDAQKQQTQPPQNRN